MALNTLHMDVKERMLEMFTATEREAYANGFDLRHYRQDVLKKRILEAFRIHPYTEDEFLEKIQNNAWVYNYILHKTYNGDIHVPNVFQRYCAMYAADMYDIWFQVFLKETYL